MAKNSIYRIMQFLDDNLIILALSNNEKDIIHMGHFATIRSRSGGDVIDLLRNFLYESIFRKIHTQFVLDFF